MAFILVITEAEESHNEIINEISSDHTVEQYCCNDIDIEFLENKEIDLMLLFVNSIESNNLQICGDIKRHQDLRKIPLILITSLNTQDFKMLCYESGADDYIHLPCQPEDLWARVEITLKHSEVSHQLEEKCQEALETAYTFMDYNNDLSVIIDFLEKCYHLDTYMDLIHEVQKILGNINISAAVYVEGFNQQFEIESDGRVVTPLVSEIFCLLKRKGTIYDFGARTIFNFKYVSLLVKNMPLHDMEKYGRIKDNLALLLGGVNARIQTIRIGEQLREERKNSITLIKNHIRSAFGLVKDEIDQHQKKSAEIVKELLTDFDSVLIALGLTEEQEEYFLSMIDETMEKIVAHYVNGYTLDTVFNKVVNELDEKINSDLD